MAKICSFFLLFLLIFSFESHSQEGGIGQTLDSFNKDFKNIPFPRDKNTDIIEENQILKALPDNVTADKIFVRDFDFSGNRLFDKKTLQSLLLNFVNQDQTLAGLNKAADVITNYYRSKGYLISYAYIAPQIVKNNVIVINVLEGEVGDIRVEGLSDYKAKFVKNHLKSLQKDVILRAPYLERKLLLLNSYMDLDVKASLVPGKSPGSSDIVIYAKEKKPYRLSFSVDDYGSKETSWFRLNAAALVGNLFKSGDMLGVHLSMGLDNFNPEDLFYGRLEYRIPFGGDGFKLGIRYAHGNYRAVKKFKPLNMRGDSNEYTLFAEYPIVLKTNFTLNILGKFTKKDVEDKLLGERNSADGIYTLTADLFGQFYPWRGSAFFYSLRLDQGINQLFNGSHLSYGSSNPKASGTFERFNVDLDYYQSIFWFLRFRGSFSAQVASGPLFSSEKFYIGGMYSVRGFESGIDSGDYGYRLSLEAEADLYTPIVKVVVFYDRGYVVNNNEYVSGYKSASLDAIGAGLHIYPWGGISLKADYGFPVAASRQKLSNGVIYVRVGYDF